MLHSPGSLEPAEGRGQLSAGAELAEIGCRTSGCLTEMDTLRGTFSLLKHPTFFSRPP